MQRSTTTTTTYPDQSQRRKPTNNSYREICNNNIPRPNGQNHDLKSKTFRKKSQIAFCGSFHFDGFSISSSSRVKLPDRDAVAADGLALPAEARVHRRQARHAPEVLGLEARRGRDLSGEGGASRTCLFERLRFDEEIFLQATYLRIFSSSFSKISPISRIILDISAK